VLGSRVGRGRAQAAWKMAKPKMCSTKPKIGWTKSKDRLDKAKESRGKAKERMVIDEIGFIEIIVSG